MDFFGAKFIFFLGCALLFGVPLLQAEGKGSFSINYIREVANELYLSDFQLGSAERIRDPDGNGVGVSMFLANQGSSFWALEFGRSTTKYQGKVEDGVNVSFVPQPGSGFEALSSSSNVVYEMDLEFANPYIGLNYTNWAITRASHGWLLPSTYGIGRIQQKAKGEVRILSLSGVELARAKYRSGLHDYYQLGWAVNFDFVYLSLTLRHVTSPVLEVLSCNEAAIGKQACDRFYAATGNRDAATQIFTGGVMQIGILF